MKIAKKLGKIAVLFTLLIVFCIGAGITAFSFLPANHLPWYQGRFQIASAGIDVMLMEPYLLSNHTKEGQLYNAIITQWIVDKNDCAAQFWKDASGVILEDQATGSVVIADHDSQNFATLKDCAVGDIAAIIRADGTIEEYVVTQNFIGINAGNDLEYEQGGSALKDNPGGIIVYTCADKTAIPVHILFLQPKDINTK